MPNLERGGVSTNSKGWFAPSESARRNGHYDDIYLLWILAAIVNHEAGSNAIYLRTIRKYSRKRLLVLAAPLTSTIYKLIECKHFRRSR